MKETPTSTADQVPCSSLLLEVADCYERCVRTQAGVLMAVSAFRGIILGTGESPKHLGSL